MVSELLHRKCKSCESGIAALNQQETSQFLQQVPGWVPQGERIEREFRFKDFVQAINFVNRVAKVAEDEGHHPDFQIHYNKVTLVLWTHSIGGLSENDFIVAAKINKLLS
ncbi:MAG: 4a-hydroxytetrahydrobiopterin dehydratase [Deltaproteobacteria bacterium]|nr:4a-hydroxytetrahydrobiopterin dehydratase [Deltaproteobacteria bacterium]